MDITQVAKVDIQPDKTINEALPNLVKYEPVSDNNIGLQRIYELLCFNQFGWENLETITNYTILSMRKDLFLDNGKEVL